MARTTPPKTAAEIFHEDRISTAPSAWMQYTRAAHWLWAIAKQRGHTEWLIGRLAELKTELERKTPR
jgi:hypothetical protein